MLDQRKDQQRVHRLHSVLVACRPGSNLQVVVGPAGSTFAVVVARTVLQEARIGPGAVRSLGRLVGRGSASRSSRCCWAGPAGMAACRPGCRGQRHGGLGVGTGGTAAVRPIVTSVG
jgi:hypothetical protein